MDDVILACDIGTSRCKLAAFNLAGRVLAATSAAYGSTASASGGAEQRPGDWLAALRDSVGRLDAVGHVRRASCIAFTGQMSAALAVDSQAAPLRPCLIWSDHRATAEASLLARRIGAQAFHTVTGHPPSAVCAAAKAMWIKRHEPELYAHTAKFLQPKDWLIAVLTGVMAVEPSDASCTGLLDLRAGVWSTEIAEAAGFDLAKMPELLPGATIVGRITAAGSAASQLPHGLPVVLGGGDGPSAALGAGAMHPGDTYVSLGTSAWLSRIAERPADDPRLFTLRHLVPGLLCQTGATQNAGNVLEWLAGTVRGGGTLDEVLDAALAATPAGAAGLLCLPALNGERTPLWSAEPAGVFFGLRSHHGPEHLLRSAAEGVCHHLRWIADVFAATGTTSGILTAVGGLAENARFLALVASVTGRSLRPASSAGHATCKGAAMLGAVAIGARGSLAELRDWVTHGDEIPPEPAAAARAASDHPAFLSLHERLAPVFASRLAGG